MRLTLRTMLAYLDDVLSEADAHELRQKIDNSDFATGLVHKIRNSISRLRLSSPELLGSDAMDDPNTVAEFIDSALAPEKEQEFEKVCLQSDKHLSEVASSHQILTLVLGTPARVEPRLRDRIYRTGIPGDGAVTPLPVGPNGRRDSFRRVDAADAALATTALGTAKESTQQPVEIKRPRTIGDSRAALAEFGQRQNLWPIAAAVLLGFLLTGGFLIAMGPLDSGHPLAGLLGLKDDPIAQNTNLESADAPSVAQLNSASVDVPASTTHVPELPSDGLQPSQASGLVPADTPTVEPNTPSTPAGGAWVVPDETVNVQPPINDPAFEPEDSVPAAPPIENTAVAAFNGTPKETSLPDALNVPPFDIDSPIVAEATNGPETNLAESELDLPPVIEPFADGVDNAPADAALAAATAANPDAHVDDPGIRDPFAVAPNNTENGLDNTAVATLEVEPNEPPLPDRAINIPGFPNIEGEGDAGANANDVAVTDAPGEVVAENVQPEAEQPVEVGRFLSEDQVIVYWDDQTETWLRLPPRTAFGVGHRLRTLENYRPQLLLAPGNVQLTSRGNSEILFVEHFDAQTPTLAIPFGRLLLNSTGRDDARIAIQTGERLVVIEFTEPDTEVVCQIRPVLIPGADPRQEDLHFVAQLWVTRGSAKIGEQGEDVQVDMGSQYAFADDAAPRVKAFQKIPEWLHSRVGEVDRDAAAELETLIPLGRDAILSLTETADSRRTDVRSWAVRHLVALDNYRVGTSLFSIADRKHQLTWPALFDELRAVIARGPDTADEVRRTFEGLYGQSGDKLYQMLIGFDDEQLKAGAAEQLVADLDNPRTEFRILAIQNLQRMTGKTLLYSPVQSEKNRSNKINRWKNELKKGKVAMVTKPEHFADWEHLTSPALP